MDTTLMEYTAEDLIAHKLLRAGILVSKPKFDQEGADLLALMEVRDGAKFCRIQCKGRNLINSLSSSIKIPKKYVTGSFVVFLFVEDGNEERTHLFAFFRDDIQKWNLNENVIYENSNKKVRVQKNRIGIYETEIINKSAGVARVGQQCPGNLDNFDYDPSTDSWKARM